ncbi:competence/damage-inducible protein A [Fictibacillus phosphorivorans]|uniref:competence/damage-inducible protein A n=1 Tax=Fictibacillus phosphorivorans TaxID=1221500 RepID=UPI00203E1E5D|nr:competence/damage-inducible protein A [Fictibacillus phosphorivorans]MCM3717088.1 competence/damage-inducible protein A [Fictibacillus phosphorivorans]MCM3774775.1 competence/damage-inducible protein A [Fictibacillus phosphorivorans]
MNAEIIAVGSELLLGQIVNSNAQYISKGLADIGVNVFYHTVAGDNEKRLSSVISTANSRSNLLIFTGGLGPTKDDLTKETVAKLFNKELVHDEDSLRYITNYFEQTGREMTENNKKQALVIKGSKVLPNEHGMAPGMAFTEGNITCIMLPGPPSEMKPMFINYAVPYLLSKMEVQTRLYSRVLKFFGIGESILETRLQDLIEKQTNPTIAPLASEHEVTIRLTAAHNDPEEANKLLDQTEAEVVSRASDYFYGYENDTLEKQTIDSLMRRNATVASAESLTGGLFGKVMTDQPGSSSVFKGGIIAYSNELKKNLLNVPESLLKEHGAVSEECAKWMAEHIKKMAKADYGISFTGVAGPEQQEGRPVGTVYIGVSGPQKTKVFDFKLAGTRKSIREKTVKHGMYVLNQLVKEGQ